MQIKSIQSAQFNNSNNKSFKAEFVRNANYARLWNQQKLTQALEVDARRFAKKYKKHLLEVTDTTEENGVITSFTVFNHKTGKLKKIKNTWRAYPDDIMANFFNRVLRLEFTDLFDENNALIYNLITKG